MFRPNRQRKLQGQTQRGLVHIDEWMHTMLTGGEGNFENLPIVQRCLKMTQGRLESLKYAVVDEDDNQMPTPRWLVKPSFRTLTAGELIGEAVYALFMTGGWILAPMTSGGVVDEVFSYSQDDVGIRQDGANPRILYTINNTPLNNVSHVKWMVKPNQIEGISAVASAKQYFDILQQANAFTAEFYKKGSATQLIVTSQEIFGDEYAKNLEEAFRSKTGGVENAWKPMFFDGNVKVMPVSITQDNAQFIDTLELYNRYIATQCFGIPAAIVDLEKSGSISKYSNPAGRQWQLWEDTLRTVVVKVETAVSRLLDDGQYFKLDTTSLLSGTVNDQTDRAVNMALANERAQKFDQDPYFTREEVRQAGGFKPDG